MEETIFGREEHIELIGRRIRGLRDGYRQNIAILGDELVGKTSIISKFLSKYYDNYTLTAYVEVRPESAESFAKRFIGVLLYNFLHNSNMPLKEDLEFLLSKSSSYLPRTTGKARCILSGFNKRNKNNVVAELFSLCDLIYQETGKFCVVILDEFHNLEGFGIKNFYKDWAKLLMLQKTTLYILISSMKYKTRLILSKNLSLLFGNFEIINIEPFDIKTSEDYLSRRLQDIQLNSALKNFLVNLTGGYPFYLSVISQALLTSRKDLIDILMDILFESSGILNQRFSSYLKGFLDTPYNKEYLAILHLISSGHNRLKDIAHMMHKPKTEILSRVNHLLELDTINRSGDFLTINDRVFGYWLMFVYENKSHSLTFNAQNQKNVFRQNLQKMLDDFLSVSQKSVTERTAELMHLFQDDMIQLERKRLKLTHFREIKPLEFGSSSLKEGLIGRSSDSLWIIAFKNGLLTEECVSEFAKECKKYRNKLERKIIIAIQDIDDNAKLRAMEEKIWTWDIGKLNCLLDIFLKPRVII